ncbi:MAG: T9SS type A sorting domain-containing protein [Crocinitomicaceae bacterium]
MLNNTYSIFALAVCLAVSPATNKLFAQTGPAGVGSSVENQIWLDAHSLGASDGSFIPIWPDLSGNGSNFTQGFSERQPIYNIDGIGGVPSLTFDGVNDVLISGSMPSMETNEFTYFIVYDRTTTTSDMLIVANYTSNYRKFRTYMNNGQNTIISAQYSPTIKWVRYTDPPGASFLQTEITPTTIKTYNQGDLEMSKTATFTTPTGHIENYLGNQNAAAVSSYTYTGEMAEVILYTSTLNDLEKVLIENYLGAKYSMSIPTDLYDYEAEHKFGLIGIGNDGSNSQTVAQGAGELELSGATDLGSDEYFLVAHSDHSFTTYTDADLPVDLDVDDHERLERTWRVGETGDVGTTTLSFNMGDGDYAAADSYRLLIDDDGDFSDCSVETGTYEAGVVTFEVNLEDGDYFTISGIPEILVIHSITDGLWSETSTWDCTCIPGANDEVYIDPSTSVTVDVDAVTGYLKVEFLGELIMSDDEVTLDINQNFDITGEIDFTAGTVAFTGVVPQEMTILSTFAYVAEINDILVDNGIGNSLTFKEQQFNLNGSLDVNSGDIIFDASTKFVVTSTGADQSGRIGSIIGSSSVTGNLTVERFIPAGWADWRNICSPVIGSTFDDWDPDLAMSGPDFPDGCAYELDGYCFRSVTWTDHSIKYDVLSSSDPIVNLRGYEVFMGTDLETFEGTTLRSQGTLNPATEVVKSFTTGWTIMGNPYASPIAYNTLTKSGSISRYFYVYDASTGGYQWYDQDSETASIPEITGDGLIASGQAVWVYAGSVGTVTFTQANKVSADATYIRTADAEDNNLHLTLTENETPYACTVMLQEKAGATDGIDDIMDIRHLSTGKERAPSIAVKDGDNLIRKNCIAPDTRDKSFDLFVRIVNDAYHTVSLGNWAYFRDYQDILLYDHKTGETIDLKEENYVFYGEAEESENVRFTLILRNAADAEDVGIEVVENESGTAIQNNLEITQMGNLLNVQSDITYRAPTVITLTNILGQEIVYKTTTTLLSGKNLITLPENLTGFHIITFTTGDEVVTQKVIL